MLPTGIQPILKTLINFLNNELSKEIPNDHILYLTFHHDYSDESLH